MKKYIITILLLVPLLLSATPVRLPIEQSFGPTTACDDLWQIAKKLHNYDKDITLQQIMLALLQKNPRSFYQHNINGLLKGYQLVIPSIEEIKQNSPEKAKKEVIRQNTIWKKTMTTWKKHPSLEYKKLKKRCCTQQHIEHLIDRFHESISFSVKKVKENPFEKQLLALQEENSQLTEKNKSLQIKIDQLVIEKDILKNDNLAQWTIIEKMRKEMTIKQHKYHLSLKPMSRFNEKHTIKKPFSHLFQSTSQTIHKHHSNIFKKSSFSLWINKLTPTELSLTITVILLILLSFALWLLSCHDKKQNLPSKKKTTFSEQEIESEDIMATKMDLARVYIDMGEQDRAKGILENVLQQGNDTQKSEAQALLQEITQQ